MTLLRARRLVAGVGMSVFLVVGPGVLPAPAQTNGDSFTSSTTSRTSFESPPACSVVGSSRQVVTNTLTTSVGPLCIGIGNRDVPNPNPDCQGLPTVRPPASGSGPPIGPEFGTVFLLQFGDTNFNSNRHTETIQCVAAVPALPVPLFVGLGGALAGLGLWRVRHSGRIRRT